MGVPGTPPLPTTCACFPPADGKAPGCSASLPLMTRACVAVWRAVIFWHWSNLTHQGTLWIKVRRLFSFSRLNKIVNMKPDVFTKPHTFCAVSSCHCLFSPAESHVAPCVLHKHWAPEVKKNHLFPVLENFRLCRVQPHTGWCKSKPWVLSASVKWKWFTRGILQQPIYWSTCYVTFWIWKNSMYLLSCACSPRGVGGRGGEDSDNGQSSVPSPSGEPVG